MHIAASNLVQRVRLPPPRSGERCIQAAITLLWTNIDES